MPRNNFHQKPHQAAFEEQNTNCSCYNILYICIGLVHFNVQLVVIYNIELHNCTAFGKYLPLTAPDFCLFLHIHIHRKRTNAQYIVRIKI